MSRFEFFTALRYALPIRSQGASGLLSLLSLAGLALSVFGLIVVTSVMNGFERELQSRMLAIAPQAKIQWSYNTSSDNESNPWQSVGQALLAIEEVTAVAPTAEGMLILSGQGDIRAAKLTAIDVQLEAGFSQLDQSITEGDFTALNKPYQLALGRMLAHYLGVSVGDKLTVTLPQIKISPFGPVVRSKKMQVAALFESGTALDSSLVVVNLSTANKLLAASNQTQQLKIKVDNSYQMESVLKNISATAKQLALQDAEIVSWQEENAALYAAVVMEKLMIFILLLCVVAVASFSIIAIVLMSVLDKKSDIAILRTMGASQTQIRHIFLLQGALIGAAGAMIGAVLGCLVAPVIGEIVSYLEGAMGFQLFDPDIYYIAYLPSLLEWRDVVIVTTLSLLISVLVSIFPAGRAAKLDPVVALSSMRF